MSQAGVLVIHCIPTLIAGIDSVSPSICLIPLMLRTRFSHCRWNLGVSLTFGTHELVIVFRHLPLHCPLRLFLQAPTEIFEAYVFFAFLFFLATSLTSRPVGRGVSMCIFEDSNITPCGSACAAVEGFISALCPIRYPLLLLAESSPKFPCSKTTSGM